MFFLIKKIEGIIVVGVIGLNLLCIKLRNVVQRKRSSHDENSEDT